MHILFTGVGRRIELLQAFRTAALVLNKPLVIYGADMTDTAPALAYCDFSRIVVGMEDAGYIENLIKICIEDHIDLLIPTIDTDLIVLSESKKRFESVGTRVLISNPEMVLICQDKNKSSKFFMQCGLKTPVIVNDWHEYESGFPAFIKPKDGSSSINTFKIENEEELRVHAAQIKDYIIQPYISGREYTIDVFCDWYGIPALIVPRERLQTRTGEVNKTRICMDAAMIDEAKTICKFSKPCGPLTIQLIRDAFGNDWFIEMNSRYAGGAPLSMKAGGRSAEIVLKLLDGESVGYQNQIADGATYSRFDQSVCTEEGQGQIKGVIFDLDDTLYSEKDYIRSGFKAVSDFLGGGYEDRLWQYFTEGKPAIDTLLTEMGCEHDKQEALRVYRSNKPDIHLYNGVTEMIDSIKARGIRVGIITDGRPEGQRNKIKALGLNMEDVIITDELGGRQFRKPCDIAFRIMITRWRLNPSEIIYVGDNPNKDFQAPKQLGIKSLWFKNPDGLYSSRISMNNYEKMPHIDCCVGGILQVAKFIEKRDT